MKNWTIGLNYLALLGMFLVLGLVKGKTTFAGGVIQPAEDTPLTKIENADLVCENKGTKVAFDSQKHRVWQTDPKMTDGYDLRVIEFKLLPGNPCEWRVLAEQIVMGMSIKYFYETERESSEANEGEISLRVSLFDNPTGTWKTIVRKIPCEASQ